MSQISDLRSWLLASLREEIEQKHPSVVAAFHSSAPKNDDDLIQAWVVTNVTFTPMEPWNSVLPALFGLEIALDQLELVIEIYATSADRRTAFLLEEMVTVIAFSCLERLEFSLTRLGRGRNPPLIAKPSSSALIAELQAARNRFAPMRHYAAHGPQLGLTEDGWLAAAGKMRLWELMALNQENGDSGFGAFFSDSGVLTHQQKCEKLRGFTMAVKNLVEDVIERALKMATS